MSNKVVTLTQPMSPEAQNKLLQEALDDGYTDTIGQVDAMATPKRDDTGSFGDPYERKPIKVVHVMLRKPHQRTT